MAIEYDHKQLVRVVENQNDYQDWLVQDCKAQLCNLKLSLNDLKSLAKEILKEKVQVFLKKSNSLSSAADFSYDSEYLSKKELRTIIKDEIGIHQGRVEGFNHSLPLG